MTNTELLKQYIAQSGYKITFVAKKCGLSYQGLLNKITNKVEFRASEIQTLCDLLGIDVAKKEEVFFCSESR